MEGETTTISNPSSEKPVHSISILLVDDDLTCLSIVAAMLKKFKYEVVTVKHPKDALCTLRIKEGAFDLVVSDVHMPDMDGFELQKVIAQEFNLPVVLMSADDRDCTVSKGFDNGALSFLPKPVSADDLRDIWQYAGKNKKSRVAVEEIECLPDRITSPEKINLDEITVSDSPVDEDMYQKKDLKKKSPKITVSDDNDNRREISGSSSPKKPKLVWTNSLHNRFLEAIRKIGLDKAVPKKILEEMDVPGLTRENVASHLQKYRIFLRRVTDASYEVHYGFDEGLTNSFRSRLASLGSDSSISILNKFTKNNYENTGCFPYSIPPSSSSGLIGSGLTRLLSNKGNFLKPNVTTPNLLINGTDRSHVRFGQDSNRRSPSAENHFSTASLDTLTKYGLSATFNATSSGENIGTSSNIISTEPSKSSTYRTNYVGYRISNLKHLIESGFSKKNQGLQSSTGVMDLPDAENQSNNLNFDAIFPDEHTNIDDILDQFMMGSISTPSLPNNNGGKQLSDVIADYQMLISNSNLPSQNGDGIDGEANSPLFDFDEFDIMSTEQSLDLGELYQTALADQTSFESQEQAQQVRQCHVSHEIGSTSQFIESTHQSLNQDQQARNRDFTDSLEAKASSQLNDIFLSPTEDEDREFLESLLSNLPGENQTLDGVLTKFNI